MVNTKVIKCIVLSIYLLVAGCTHPNPNVVPYWYLKWDFYNLNDSSVYTGAYTISLFPKPDLMVHPHIYKTRAGTFNSDVEVWETAEEMFNGKYFLDVKMFDTNNNILLDTSISWKDLDFKPGFTNYNDGSGDFPVDYLSTKAFYIKNSKSEIVEVK